MAKSQNQEAPRLTAEQAGAGARAAARNARALLEDARVLFDAGRYARGVAMTILAVEEADKPWLVAWIAASPSEALLVQRWKDYRDHRKKNVTSAVMHSLVRHVENEGMPPDPVAALLQAMKTGPSDLDAYKQRCFYTGPGVDGQWNEPEELVRARDVLLTEIAESKVLAAEQSPFRDDRCVALFVQHIGPATGTPQMPTALAEFGREALALGLCDAAWVAAISAFL